MRSFRVICPFCEGAYPFPDDLDEVYRCQCGAVYKIAWHTDMENAMDQLISHFLKDGGTSGSVPEESILCSAVIFENIENLITMKRDYEASKYLRTAQSFDQNYPQKVGLVWIGSHTRQPPPSQ